MLKTDFHTHAGTDREHALLYTPRQLIGRMAKLGYEAVSITNHERVAFSRDIKRYAAGKDILLIPGIEKRIEGKEVIILNATKKAERLRTFRDLEKYRKSNSIFTLAPHPFYPEFKALHSDLERNISLFDGIEFSHFYLSWWTFNSRAVKLAEKHRLPLIGTSDCHTFRQLDRTYTLVDSGKNTNSLFEAMRKRKTRLVTRPLPFFMAVKTLMQLYFRY